MMVDRQPAARILIVEDEFLVRLTLVEALLDEGYQVVEAANGDEALALLQADPAISMLMTDVRLPGALDGLALVRAARERRSDLPAVYMTGRPDALAGSLTPGRDALLAKPYLPSEATMTVRRLISGES
ncbi:MAG: response regulator [Acetobacteraceae bacterium]|nr:response regulator [Acetobacteraceae bacterium]